MVLQLEIRKVSQRDGQNVAAKHDKVTGDDIAKSLRHFGNEGRFFSQGIIRDSTKRNKR